VTADSAWAATVLDPLFLPYSERELLQHFVPSERDHLAAWRVRIHDAASKLDDPAYLHRDETLWTASALLAVHRPSDRRERWRRVLVRAFGEQPPLDESVSWEAFLDGELKLLLEVGLSSPETYRRWLSDRLPDRLPIVPEVELAQTRGVALERHTKLDALLLNVTDGYAVHFEAKVLSDIDTKTKFDALRNQLARNIDALAAPPPTTGPLSPRRPDRSLLALLTPALFRTKRSSRLYGHLYYQYRSDPAALHRDLAHLDPSTCASLAQRLGWLAFEDLMREDPASCLWLADHDDPVGKATIAAARRLEQLELEGKPVRERQLQEALAAELSNAEIERRVHVPEWDPQPGALDVLTRDDSGDLRTVVETKLKAGNDIFECLWDFAKVLSIARGPSTPAAYVVAGTTLTGWGRHATTELFVAGRHALVGTMREHLSWWDKYILGDSVGRPVVVPEFMDVRVVARVGLQLRGADWELRTLRVMGREPLVPFYGGRPGA
jgi:hypothetical protein